MAKSKEPVLEEWAAEPLPKRLDKCRSLLYVHSMISDGENKAIKQRMIRERDRKRD
jgi:hypothetical protein